jgi:hypothetical protein
VTQFPSALLALALVYPLSRLTHRMLGTALGALADLVLFFVIFYYVNRYLRELRDG